jgi:hypothetical protein
MPDRPPRYHAYLLRLWEERSDDGRQRLGWRFQLEDAHTQQRHGFADLAALLAYLRALTDGADADGHPADGG